MADLYSTDVLIRVVRDLKVTPQFLLDTFFPIVQTEQSEEIHFDVENRTRRLAPFVSPVVAGQVVVSEGFETKTFRPAYIKDKRVLDSSRPFKRSIGERIGGELSPMERQMRILGDELRDQINMINRRLEVMAAEALRTGAVTVSGEQYPTRNVDFQRDAALTVTLTGTALWSDPASKPLNDLAAWSNMILKKEGVGARTVVMDPDAFQAFLENNQVQSYLDNRRIRQREMLAQNLDVEGGRYEYSFGGIDIYQYGGWYVDSAGVEQPILPSGTVLVSTPALEGVRAFGAIRDEEAGFQALPYYSKSWVEKDPSVRYLLMQSAPLVVPTRVNASLAATVL